jgi:syntaxin 18
MMMMMIDRTDELRTIAIVEYEKIKGKPSKGNLLFHDDLLFNKTSTAPLTPLSSHSVFIQTANAIRDEIYRIGERVDEHMRYYLRTWALTPNISSPQDLIFEDVDEEDHRVNIEQSLKEATDHITQLDGLLGEAEKNVELEMKKKQQKSQTDEEKILSTTSLNLSSHQRAHYRSIIIILYNLTQTVSNKLKLIRTLEAQKLTHAMKLFSDELTTYKPKAEEEAKLKHLQLLEQENEEKEREEMSNNLDQEQRQLLEKENQWLNEEINQWLNDALDAEKSAMELAELIHLFDQKVSEQAEQIEMLYENAKNSEELMKQAKDELQKAKETSQGRGSSWLMNIFGGKVLANIIRYFVLYFIIGASLLILILDMITK